MCTPHNTTLHTVHTKSIHAPKSRPGNVRTSFEVLKFDTWTSFIDFICYQDIEHHGWVSAVAVFISTHSADVLDELPGSVWVTLTQMTLLVWMFMITWIYKCWQQLTTKKYVFNGVITYSISHVICIILCPCRGILCRAQPICSSWGCYRNWY